MSGDHEAPLARWVAAGLIDRGTADRIRAFEAAHPASARLRWPARLALGFGGLTLAAGLLLFIAAHWDRLSPGARFGTVIASLAAVHLAGAWATRASAALASTLHAVGTVALGAGIFLSGQIFHLDTHWPTGFLLWAAGAWIGWALLRDWPQGLLAALLTPAWFAAEWIDTTWGVGRAHAPLVATLLLIALAYIGADGGELTSTMRRALARAGAIVALPLAVMLPAVANDIGRGDERPGLMIVGWAAGVGFALVVAWMLRRRDAWPVLLAVPWVIVGAAFDQPREAGVYVWGAVGAAALALWGVRDGRAGRVNLGIAGFALTVLFFYFSSVMDRLGRSTSLIGLGILLLGGGYALERVRRRLSAEAEENRP